MFDWEGRIMRAANVLESADRILIGGGAGLSDAAGLHYSGARFTDHFADYIEKYGFSDLYTSSFHTFEREEERWAYWAKHISLNRYETPATELYKALHSLVRHKPYFVLTTNVDHQFIKAGFPEAQVFAVQGDYGWFQCARGCHATLYDNEAVVRAMLEQTRDFRIPAALVPHCPVCGGAMDVNLRKDAHFVQDENWYAAERRFEDFVRESREQSIVYLELGVGFNTPDIIRFPFERWTQRNPNATLLRINRDAPEGIRANAARTIAFSEDLERVVRELLRIADARRSSL